ncbi:TnsA endonuclease N-terminal domain-containing protein [Ectopseudomonas oleovorans]|uniref:TnsA endonuclease N-terminal domain-containing protein n=1 Tax=Ectopseudomonas oleovorans TaxID=301 RepID=UPI00244AC649|nr:TnsA endonuclease N-terminal domain-containing protein [Pseudomonas oleovorans]MDH2201244.1 TnsA endonuclease N-terminal domain-containing protein [Pseudomonas oleovorans]
MAGTFKGLNQAQIDRRLKEGRGQGHGPDYKPFIYTRDVSSLGRSHRLPGSKTRRLHHLLSDLELAIFLTLDWSFHVTDIREQFPMRVDDTVRIAEEFGLPHGHYQSTPQVLTSDFLVDFDDPKRPTVAIQAKYSADLQRPEVIERLELERRYWQEKGIPWVIVTEREVSREAFSNIQWLYPAQAEDDISLDDLAHYRELFLHEFQRHPDWKLIAIAQGLDASGQLESGQALYWLRQLLARHCFLFDIGKPYRELKPKDLAGNPNQTLQGLNHVAR